MYDADPYAYALLGLGGESIGRDVTRVRMSWVKFFVLQLWDVWKKRSALSVQKVERKHYILQYIALGPRH